MVNLTATFCVDRVTIKNWQNACGAMCLFMFGHSDIYMGKSYTLFYFPPYTDSLCQLKQKKNLVNLSEFCLRVEETVSYMGLLLLIW